MNKQKTKPQPPAPTEEVEGEEESEKLVEEIQSRTNSPIIRKTATEIKPEPRSADGKAKMLPMPKSIELKTEVEIEESEDNLEPMEERAESVEDNRNPKFKTLPVDEIEEKSIETAADKEEQLS